MKRITVATSIRSESRANPGSEAVLRGVPVAVSQLSEAEFLGREPSSAPGRQVAVARPQSAEEIEALVKWAGSGWASLGLISSSPHPHQDMSSLDQDLYVDLSRMKRLFHVDSLDAVAIVEPGLTFAELDGLLAPHGLRTFKPLLPRAGKSVIASHLEREPLLVAREHWDVLDPFGAGEIIFGSGERFHTGAAGNPGRMDDHWKAGMRYMTATGPAGTDFMRVLQGAQGTLGIVTWAAIFCDRVPAAEESFFIAAETPEPLLDLSAELHYRRLGHYIFLSNRAHLALLARAAGAPVDPATLPAWSLLVAIAATGDLPQEHVAFEAGDTKALAAAAGLLVAPSAGGLAAQAVVDAHAKLHADDYRDGACGSHRSVFFLTQGDHVPSFVRLAATLAPVHGVDTADIAVYVQPRLQGRNCHLEFVIPHAPADADRVDAFATALAQACCDRGGFFSRPYGDWTAMAYARNPSIVPYLRQCKAMFDPKGILHPGRLGL